MASPWFTYTPHSPPPRDVQASNLADKEHTVPSELMVSDASLVSIDSAKHQALGRAGRNPSVSSIPPFNSIHGAHTESTGKAAPILVSATSFNFEFREPGPSTRTAADKPHTSAMPQTPHSPVSSDVERYERISEDADIAATYLAGPTPIPSTHKHVGPQSSLSSSTFERDVLASSPTKRTHAVAPISATENVTPPSPPDSTTAQAITTGDVSIIDSPNMGASQTPTVKLSLTQSPEHGRGRSERQHPKRLSTGGSAGSGSTGVVQSRYADMVFEEVPRTHNLLSGLFTWVLLAGFVVLPGTFNSLESFQSKSGEVDKVLRSIHHLPLCVHFFRPESTLLTLCSD